MQNCSTYTWASLIWVWNLKWNAYSTCTAVISVHNLIKHVFGGLNSWVICIHFKDKVGSETYLLTWKQLSSQNLIHHYIHSGGWWYLLAWWSGRLKSMCARYIYVFRTLYLQLTDTHLYSCTWWHNNNCIILLTTLPHIFL